MRRRKLMTKLSMLLFLSVLVAGLFLQGSRLAQLRANTKLIEKYEDNISQLTIDTQHLQIQISAKANIARIEDRASELGMASIGKEQIHLVSLPAGYGDTTVVQVADSQNAG